MLRVPRFIRINSLTRQPHTPPRLFEPALDSLTHTRVHTRTHTQHAPAQSEWPAYGGNFTVAYDPFGDGKAFGSTAVTVDSTLG